MVQGERVEHAFEVRNRGGSDLLLEEVKVGGVLKVEGFDRVIPPGGSGRVRVSVNTGGVHGVGNLVVRVISNDPEAPETALGLDGRVVKPLEIEPGDRIYFFQPGEQRRNLVRYGSRPILVTGTASDNPHFRPSYKVLAPGQRYELAVALDPAAPAGKHEGNVIVSTDNPGFPELRVPVRALVKAP